MRAVAVPRFRAPPQLMDLPQPTAGTGEVLVRVAYAGVNPYDWKIADGILDGSRPHVFPLVLGVDAAGTVEAVGAGVSRFRAGERIFGQFLHSPVGTGTYAEWTVVPAANAVAAVPSEMALDEAAALPTAGMTAYASLELLGLSAGSSLLIVGASGGIGSFATELAASRGIRVIAVARAASAERLRALGANEVFDPGSGDVRALVAKSHAGGVDGLLDVMNDRQAFAEWTSVTRRGGAAVSSVYSADSESLQWAGLRGGNVDLQPSAELLSALAEEVSVHHLRVPLERRIRLPDAPLVLAELRAGRASGKTVVDLSS